MKTEHNVISDTVKYCQYCKNYVDNEQTLTEIPMNKETQYSSTDEPVFFCNLCGVAV